MSSNPTAAELLEQAAALYRSRNKEYGNNYHRFGDIMTALFPDGLCVSSKEDWNRIGVLFHIADKLTRYTNNFVAGGHADSLRDVKVYTAMLEELDNAYNRS